MHREPDVDHLLVYLNLLSPRENLVPYSACYTVPGHDKLQGGGVDRKLIKTQLHMRGDKSQCTGLILQKLQDLTVRTDTRTHTHTHMFSFTVSLVRLYASRHNYSRE